LNAISLGEQIKQRAAMKILKQEEINTSSTAESSTHANECSHEKIRKATRESKTGVSAAFRFFLNPNRKSHVLCGGDRRLILGEENTYSNELESDNQ
jgi:hypothetical protein